MGFAEWLQSTRVFNSSYSKINIRIFHSDCGAMPGVARKLTENVASMRKDSRRLIIVTDSLMMGIRWSAVDIALRPLLYFRH
jgi:hypothetical protein